ncbi:hypothetical protein ACRC7T_18710 (plasmid) [Segnochrobactraceae bacterium EtOH-i3]
MPIIDSANPEWTEADFARSGRPEDVLPAEVLAAFPMTRHGSGQPTPSAEQAPHGRLRIRQPFARPHKVSGKKRTAVK